MKRFLTIGLVFGLFLSLLLPSVAKAEDDITGHFFEEQMRTLIEDGILKGYGNGTYLPDKPVKRSEFTALLVRSLDLKLQAEETKEDNVAQSPDLPSFPDVDPEDWYYNAVITASSYNLVNGYPNGNFGPDREITRQEMAVMIMRAANMKGVVSEKAPLNFTDTDLINPDYLEEVQRLIYLGILTGKEDSAGNRFFDPLAYTTRAQTAGVIVRTLNVLNPPVALDYKVATLKQDADPVVSGTYETFEEAKSHVSGNEVILKGNNVLYIENGLAVSNVFTNIYSGTSLSSSITYVTHGIEMKYLGATEEWVHVQIADTEGYIPAGNINLVPTNMITGRSYYEVSNGNLIHNIYNWSKDSYVSYTYGKAPSFLAEGNKYYSWDGNEFYTTNGESAGEAYQYFNRMPLYTDTQYTAEQLDAYIESQRPDSPLVGLGEFFKKAEQQHGTNALYLLSHAIHESNWGTSEIAVNKNNLFGIGAYDGNAYLGAKEYESYESGILEAAEQFIVPGYFENTWKSYGAHLGNKSSGMNVYYASDPYWGQKIAGHMYRADQFLSSTFNMEPELGKYDLAQTFYPDTNVRKAPSINGAQLYQLGKAQSTVQILSTVENSEGTWYKVAARNYEVEQTENAEGEIEYIVETVDHGDAYVYSHGGGYGTNLELIKTVK